MKTEDLLAVCNPEPIKEALLLTTDPVERAKMKGAYLAMEMYTGDITYFLGKGDMDNLKESLKTKNIEMTELFSRLILCSDPLVEEGLISQINTGRIIREKLLSML